MGSTQLQTFITCGLLPCLCELLVAQRRYKANQNSLTQRVIMRLHVVYRIAMLHHVSNGAIPLRFSCRP